MITMVKFPKVPGITAHVVVDGTDLVEYDDPDNEELPGHTAMKYIEVASGATFSFKITIGPKYRYKANSLQVDFRLDGTWVDGIIVHSAELQKKGEWSTTLSGVRIFDGQKHQMKPFTFANISLGKVMCYTFVMQESYISPLVSPA